MNQKRQVRWSDAWLLTAIYQSSREVGAGLASIIASADVINRAVPNPEELESGLFRLREAGLIEEDEGVLRFLCTSKALAMIESLTKETASLYELWKTLESRLGAIPWAPGEPLPHPDNKHSYPGFTAQVYKEAVEQYLKRMRKR